jgi:ferredoxin
MLETFLRSQDSAWPAVIRALLPEIHPVDQAATRIWFSFFPLAFHEIVEREGGHRDFVAVYQARGEYRLHAQVDTSHRFLYGHAYWPLVKQAILEGAPAGTLLATIEALAPAPRPLTLGLTAIGLMTLRQTGRAVFAAGGAKPAAKPGKTPEQVLAQRAKDKSGFLRRAQARIIFREEEPDAWFAIAPQQEITTAAEADKRPYHLTDSRCFENMGPIPVECRSGKCGTCWVGVLGGNENLSALGEWERKRLDHFGYFDSGFESLEDARPLIRLACQAQAAGSAAIVIPPWCGVPARGRKA